MKLLSIILIFVFLLSCTTSEQEKKNPLEGTTWELISGKYVREDTTLTFPKSPYEQEIIIFGKTHYSLAAQDTSRDFSGGILAKYIVDVGNFTATFKMVGSYKDIGSSFTAKFQIEGDQLIIKATDYHLGWYNWKEAYEVWSRTTTVQEEKNPFEGTTWEQFSGKIVRKDNITLISPKSPDERAIMILGKTHWVFVRQDTSRQESFNMAGTYVCKGDSMTSTLIMHPSYEDIGKSFNYIFQIEGDQLIMKGVDLHFFGQDWKEDYQIWKRID